MIIDKLNELLEKTNIIEQQADHSNNVDFADNDGGIVDVEEDIIIHIEDDEVDEAITIAGGENSNSTTSSLSAAVKDGIIRKRTKQQLAKRTLTIGWHHDRLNPLPSTWSFPRGFTVIQLINMWLLIMMCN